MNDLFPFLDDVFPKEIPQVPVTEIKILKCILHRYRRTKAKKGAILFQCAAPHCMSPPILKARLDGKEVLCYYCSSVMIMTNAKMRNSYPHCGCQKKVRKPICVKNLDLTDLNENFELKGETNERFRNS